MCSSVYCHCERSVSIVRQSKSRSRRHTEALAEVFVFFINQKSRVDFSRPIQFFISCHSEPLGEESVLMRLFYRFFGLRPQNDEKRINSSVPCHCEERASRVRGFGDEKTKSLISTTRRHV